MLPAASVGVHSAGLNKRDLSHPVIAAGIQSVYRKACDLGPFNLMVVDECHLIPAEGLGMYRSFLADAKTVNPRLRVVGLTATPYRMSTGEVCSPDGILNAVCYEIGVKELIEQGFLSPLVNLSARRTADVTGLHVRGGEYVADEVESLMDNEALVKSAVAEIVEAARDRRACLIFCAGVKHGEHVARMFREDHGIECGFVDGQTTSAQRARLIARFRGDWAAGGLFDKPPPPLKFLANINVLTTGFDCPRIDCVAMLRPTLSPGLMYQQIGRGFRLAEGKKDCLVLDFAMNLIRHGPVDLLKAGDRPKKGMAGEAPARACPECRRVVHASVMVCPECGFEFPRNEKPKHEAHASAAPVISGSDAQTESPPREYEVIETLYAAHAKRNAPPGHPPSMRVSHLIGRGYETVDEYVCPEHSGYAREKFVAWWGKRSCYPPPRSVAAEVKLAEEGGLARTRGVRVKTDENGYDRIVAWDLEARPEPDDVLITALREFSPGCAEEEAALVGAGPCPAGGLAGDPDDYSDIPF
jgi:DNA repair protein RadD